VLAEWDAAQGRMTVLGAAKVPFFNRDTLAAMLGLSPAEVDLIAIDVIVAEKLGVLVEAQPAQPRRYIHAVILGSEER